MVVVVVVVVVVCVVVGGSVPAVLRSIISDFLVPIKNTSQPSLKRELKKNSLSLLEQVHSGVFISNKQVIHHPAGGM